MFLKINPFVISIFFMLFSLDTALQKSGRGRGVPPGFDATVSAPFLASPCYMLICIMTRGIV